MGIGTAPVLYILNVYKDWDIGYTYFRVPVSSLLTGTLRKQR